ncbi:group II intron maturase-specific domain-containing protein [Mesorhizobium muleiense]|uniref:group II intron maturase-specific domain-containing protein n=1 Tax=Mesorhizobium muleiense TaxID=1004279 RepID=UPI003AFA2D0B
MLRNLDQWIRRRLRSIVWKQWKRGRTRFAELRRRGVDHDLAAQTAGSAALAIALPKAFFASIGLASVVPANVGTRTQGGVGGVEPLSRIRSYTA